MNMEYGRPKTYNDALVRIIRSEIASCRGIVPAEVLAYDASQQRATVRPMLRVSYYDPETFERVTEEALPVANVPVAWPSSGAGSITMPIAAGDKCTLWIAERSLDEWLSTGDSDIAPADPRRFDATDGILYPGGRPFSDPLPASAYASGDVVIDATNFVRLGGAGAVDVVALRTPTLDNFTLLQNALASWVPAPGDGGAALKVILTTLISDGWPNDLGATKVKAL